MNVLSLFDGISCAQIALERAGIKVNNYYASEVDKYAISVTQHNYPDTIQLGDVKKVNIFNVPDIDLLIGGFPCQGFSFAGKQLNFKDERSKLFFECVRLKNELNPRYFLFENVKMKKECQDEISKLLGVEQIEINSSLVSAQNRRRLYWTNIPNVKQPEDKRIMLKDILEKGVVDRDKSYCIDANYYKGGNLKQYFEKSRRQLVFQDSIRRKSKCVRSGGRGSYDRHEWDSVDKNHWRKLTVIECERLQTIQDNYTNTGISNTQRYKALGNGFTVDIIAHILKGIK